MRPLILGVLIGIGALGACGDDSGGGDVDATGDPADAFVDPADSAPLPDAPDPADANNNPPGLDQVCSCDPSQACPDPLDCFVSEPAPPHFPYCGTDAGVGETGVCRPRVASCATNAMDCPFPSRCLTFSDGITMFGVCAPAVGDDQACEPELCPNGWICVGPNDDNAFCREDCTTSAAVCDSTETCSPVGKSLMACVPNT